MVAYDLCRRVKFIAPSSAPAPGVAYAARGDAQCPARRDRVARQSRPAAYAGHRTVAGPRNVCPVTGDN